MTGASPRKRSRSSEPGISRPVTDVRPDCESPPETMRQSTTCTACNDMLTIAQQPTETVMTNAHERFMQVAMGEARTGDRRQFGNASRRL